MRSVSGRAMMVAAVALSLAVAAGCGSSGGSSGGSGGNSGGGGGATPVNSATCAAPVGSGKYEIVSDLPMQGASSHQTKQMVQAIEMTLKQHNYKVNGITIQYQACDDSTAQAGTWDSATCIGERQRVRAGTVGDRRASGRSTRAVPSSRSRC